MSVFTLAIFCLTTSNLPWFMDLTFQVPMQYCSLQHQTLLPSPVTSTTGCWFYFGSVSSFFLELFPHWSPAAYEAPIDLGSSSFSILSFFLAILFIHGFLKAWFAIPFSSGPHFVRWTWVGANLGDSEGKPAVLQSMGSQRVRHNLVTEQKWQEIVPKHSEFKIISHSTCS